MVTRRKFSREFKLEAVKLVTERGVTVAQADADDLAFTEFRFLHVETPVLGFSLLLSGSGFRGDYRTIGLGLGPVIGADRKQ